VPQTEPFGLRTKRELGSRHEASRSALASGCSRTRVVGGVCDTDCGGLDVLILRLDNLIVIEDRRLGSVMRCASTISDNKSDWRTWLMEAKWIGWLEAEAR
jgi:hypothetical protein